MTDTIKEVPFHPGISKYSYERSIARGNRKGLITANDERLILEFVTWKSVESNISPSRRNKITSTLVNWKRFLPVEYPALTMTDLMTGIMNMKTGKSETGNPLKTNTQHDFVRILKMFLYWMIENRYSTLPLEKVKKIQAPRQDYNTTEPHEILTKEEIEKLLNSCPNSRDRCLIGILYETGARVSEIAKLSWKDVIFDEYGVRVYITDDKTKNKRYSRVTMMTQYLAQWRADYWGPKDAEGLPVIAAPMFISREGQTLTYVGVTRIIQRVMASAGITRKITPHLFRKSRITHMVAQNYQESIIKQSMWNNLSTTMFKTYVKLSEKDIDSEFLFKSGLKTIEEKQKEALKPNPCTNCHTVNPPNANYCLKCGQPVTDKARIQVDDSGSLIRDLLSQDSDAQAIFLELLQEIQNKKNKQ